MWLDVSNCSPSSVKPLAGKQSFVLSSKKWTSNFNGEVLGVGGKSKSSNLFDPCDSSDSVLEHRTSPRWWNPLGN
jgi:hypothetical protein